MTPRRVTPLVLLLLAGLAAGCAARPPAPRAPAPPAAGAPTPAAGWAGVDVFVALGTANAVAGVDAARLSASTVAVGENVHSVAITPDGRHLLVPSMAAGGDISIVDASTGSVAARLPAQGMARHAAIGAGGRYGFVAVAPDRLVVVDLEAGREVGRLRTGAGTDYVEASPDGRWILVANREASTVTVVDAERAAVVDTIPVGREPEHVRVSGDRFYVALGGEGQVVEVSLARKTVQRTFAVGPSPHGLALTGGGRRLLVSTADALSEVDLGSGRVTKHTLPAAMAHVTASADGRQAYVAVPAWNGLAVWDDGQRRLMGVLPLGAPPHQIVLAPGAAPFPADRLQPLPGAAAPVSGPGASGGQEPAEARSEHERHHP